MDPADIENRFKFHPADEVKGQQHQAVRLACENLAQHLNEFVPEGREKALAITNLEQAMMWANAGIARNP